jgi:hypothetical protein
MRDEVPFDEQDSEIRRGRRWVGGALVLACASLAATAGGKPGLFLVLYFASFLAGLNGVAIVSRATDGSRLVRLLAMVAVFMPLVNLIALMYYLGRARSPRREPPAEQAWPKPAATPRATRGAPRDVREVRKAIASVRTVAPGVEDGAEIVARAHHPEIRFSEDSQPALRSARDCFVLGYMVDEGELYSMVNRGQMRTQGLGIEELHALGVRNLAARAITSPGVKVVVEGTYYGLVMGGDFEASLVLVDELWDGPLRKYIPNGAVVGIPARDICVFCDSRSSIGIAEVKRIVARVTAGGRHLVSDKLLLRKNGQWRVLGAQTVAA